MEGGFVQFYKMTIFERTKHFVTIFLLLVFALLFGYPAVLKLLDDETVFIEKKSEYLNISLFIQMFSFCSTIWLFQTTGYCSERIFKSCEWLKKSDQMENTIAQDEKKGFGKGQVIFGWEHVPTFRNTCVSYRWSQ